MPLFYAQNQYIFELRAKEVSNYFNTDLLKTLLQVVFKCNQIN